MRSLAAVVFLLALFGASTQCVADCLAQTCKHPAEQGAPPCHSQSKNHSAPAPCRHAQLVADTHTSADVLAVAPAASAMCAQAAEIPAPVETAFEFVSPEISPPGSARTSYSILRL